MSKVIAIIQARLGSQRLPNKVLADIHGKPMLQHVLERARQIQGLDQIVVAWPEEDRDQVERSSIQSLIWGREDVSMYCIDGDPHDVLRRYYHVASKLKADVILRLTGDCPLIDAAVSSVLLDFFHGMRCDYAANIQPYTQWPDGLDSECLTFNALEMAHQRATWATDREHVTPWIREHLRCRYLKAPEDLTAHKWSVDTEDDLRRVRAIYDWLALANKLDDYSWQATAHAELESLTVI